MWTFFLFIYYPLELFKALRRYSASFVWCDRVSVRLLRFTPQSTRSAPPIATASTDVCLYSSQDFGSPTQGLVLYRLWFCCCWIYLAQTCLAGYSKLKPDLTVGNDLVRFIDLVSFMSVCFLPLRLFCVKFCSRLVEIDLTVRYHPRTRVPGYDDWSLQ